MSLFSLVCLLACSADDGASEPRDDAGPEPADDGGVSEAGGQDATPGPDGASAGDQPCTSCGACTETRVVTSAQHVTGGIDYADVPPLGGSHDPCWTRFGVHDREVADEHWVHNLEHGAVVLLYHCPDGCEDELAALASLAASRPFVLVMPYAELPTRFAAVAWGHRLLTECFDEAAFEDFYARYANHGPESSTSSPPSGC